MTDPKKPARWPLLSLLVFCGGISVTLSEVHAFQKMQAATLADGLVAFLVGIAPVVAAALLAELLANSGVAGWLKAGVGLVFIGAMLLSVDAQAATVRPIVGEDLAIVFPLVLDLSTIVALLALAGVGWKTEAAADRSPAEPVADRSPVGVDAPRSVVEREPIAQEPIAPAARPIAEPIAPAALPIAEPIAEPIADRSPEPAEPIAEPIAPAPAAPAPAAAPAGLGGFQFPADMSTRDRARLALSADPGMTGARLGEVVGVSDVRGRTLRREILAELERERADAEQARPVVLRAVE